MLFEKGCAVMPSFFNKIEKTNQSTITFSNQTSF